MIQIYTQVAHNVSQSLAVCGNRGEIVELEMVVLGNSWEMVGYRVLFNLDCFSAGFWAANSWTTVGYLLANAWLANGTAKRTFLNSGPTLNNN